MDPDDLSPDQVEDQGVDAAFSSPDLVDGHGGDRESGGRDGDGDGDGGTARGKARAAEDAAQKKTRKRTKTGCITCRKRRIKCDEARPTCRNCIKSKRMCEGYSQRVVFKEPMQTFQGSHYGHLLYQPEGSHSHAHGFGGHHIDASQHSQSSHQAIAPKPPPLGFHGQVQMPYGPLFVPQGHAYPPPVSPQSATGYQFVSSLHGADGVPPGVGPFAFIHHTQQHTPPPQPSHPFMPHDQSPQSSPHDLSSSPYAVRTEQLVSPISDGSPSRPGRSYPGFSEAVIATPAISQQIYSHLRDQPYSLQLSQPPQPSQSQQPQYTQPHVDAEHDDVELVAAEYSDMSEDEWDDDVPMVSSPPGDVLADIVWAHQNTPYYDYATKMQSALDFAHEMTLAAKTPASSNAPINDPVIKAVFIHFVNMTGPTMSLYERCAFDAPKLTPGISSRGRVASVWTYTFPALALNHQALMQAILALGSLQIATTQRMPPTAAMKHYHLAIRRIARNVRSLSMRTRPATLAATLLMAYFEVWSSDHSKWCNHLFGARILFREIDMRGMTKIILPLKRAQRLDGARQQQQQQTSSLFGTFEAEFADKGMEPDDLALDIDAINELAGCCLTLEDYGLGSNDIPAASQGQSPAQINRSIGEYEQFRDLFWWYAKMDVYQSMLGGTKLFMEYHHWTQCPPRGPIGNIDLVYGSYDHLMLLLGRLASFSSRDLARKTKAFKLQRPPGPPGSSPPMFPGILPPQGKVSAPMGFSPQRDTSPYSDQSEENDAETALEIAMHEWTAISEAFDMFKARLGPIFEPLAPEYADRRDSPFGQPLQYRTFSMAGIWMNYYMGFIHLHRTHPSMPPVAMMAAGQAAPITAPYATQIGRIAAGLGDGFEDMSEVNTLVSAALIESSFCLFVAAITYRDLAQRHWMVRRMHDVARLTGWQSARQIADGCESGWIKAYQLGRGPPYERLDMRDEPSSIWANPRRIDRVIRNTPENRLALVRSERTHYALGLLSVEHDFEKLELKEEPM